MYVLARERLILDFFLNQEEPLSLKNIAERLQVSERTVRRDLEGVETLLQRFNLQLVKKVGIGICVEGEQADIEQLKQILTSSAYSEITSKERKTLILCSLLCADSSTKLIALAQELDVTEATISNDLKDLEDWIQRFELTLIRKRNYGIEIGGAEEQKRRAIISLITEHVSDEDVVALLRGSASSISTLEADVFSQKILELLNKEQLQKVEQILQEECSTLLQLMADMSYIGLAVHIALLIERVKNGQRVTFTSSQLQQICASKEFSIATGIAKKIEQVFMIQLPIDEIGYICMHLRGAKFQYDFNMSFEDMDVLLMPQVKQFIRLVDVKLGSHLTEDYALFQGLMLHLEKAIYRIRQNMQIHNPLLDKICANYEHLFLIVQQAAEQVFPEMSMPDDEIGFLVMHFGAALEQQYKNYQLKAIVVCSSGLGSSKMLANRLRREIPEITEIRNSSLLELQQLEIEKYDLILSTIALPFNDTEYTVVSPILTTKEIKKIRDIIQTKRYSPRPLSGSARPLYSDTRSAKETLDKIYVINQLSAAILRLMSTHYYAELEEDYAIEDILLQVANILFAGKVIINPSELVRQLIQRRQLGGLGIPGTQLALYHCRSQSVLQSNFSVFRLQKPLMILGMDNEQMQVRTLLFLVAPEVVPDLEMELLSYVSALIVESRESINTFNSGNAHLIVDYLSNRFAYYLYGKFQT